VVKVGQKGWVLQQEEKKKKEE